MKRLTLVAAFLLLVICIGCQGAVLNDDMLEDAQWVTPPSFQEAQDFSSGFALVEREDSTYYFVDKAGDDAFGRSFVEYREYGSNCFVDGIPTVWDHDGKTYRINLTGREYIPVDVIADVDYNLSGNIHVAMSDNEKYGLINNLRQWVVRPEYDYLKTDSDQIAKSADGYFDESLQYIQLPEGYLFAGGFRDGYALIVKYDSNRAYYNFIDMSGNVLLDESFMYSKDEYRYPSLNGNVICFTENNLYGYMDLSGQVILEPQFIHSVELSGGILCVSRESGEVEFIDIYGNTVIPPIEAEYVGYYNGAMASVTVLDSGDKKEGVIDKNGNWVIKPKYHSCYYNDKYNVWKLSYEFGETSRADVYFPDSGQLIKGYEMIEIISETAFTGWKRDNTYFVDVSGGTAVHYKFDYIGSPSEGLMVACKNDLYGYIDTQGNLILDFQFENARSFSEGVAAVQVDGKWGYIANPLVYSEWSADEVTRAQLLGIVPDGAPDETITVQEFSELLCKALALEEATLQDADVDFTQQLTRKAAATLVARAAEGRGCYYRYFLPDCDDATAVSEDNKFQTGFSIQSGIIKLQSYCFNEGATVPGEEAYQILLRTYEYCLGK